MGSIIRFPLIGATTLFCIVANFSNAQRAPVGIKEYKQDFNYFWNSINDEYCYFNKKQTNWQKVKELYLPLIEKVKNRDEFVGVIEKALYEIYDHHAILNTNTDSSRRLVPSGADIWAEFVNGMALITEVRKGFAAEACGIVAGMEIKSINGVPVQEAIKAFLPRSLNHEDVEAKSFALRLLLAGNHVQPRVLSLEYKAVVKDYFPDSKGFVMDQHKAERMIDTKMIGTIGYIRINDCLYDNALIPVFDSVMDAMRHTTGLILDLRETPSGGNTAVARAILGWFTDKENFYQKHEYFAEEKSNGIKRSWEEIVSPRTGKYYGKPLAILCDHWTGSIAEGIVIGFDALHRSGTRIIGTELARLNGAVYSYEMPFSKIHFSFPAERLYHVNGLPREKYVPPDFIDIRQRQQAATTDPFMEKAMKYLKHPVAHQANTIE